MSCSGGADPEIKDIENYIKSKNLTIIDTLGIYVAMDLRGIDTIKPSSEVTLEYTGTYLDDEIFDMTPEGAPVVIKMSNIIKGLQLGLQLFGKKGEGTIIVPSNLGFAANPPRGIRNNATLVYKVKIDHFE